MIPWKGLGTWDILATVICAAAAQLPAQTAHAHRPVEVLFTFDDGPDLAYSARIAELIEEHGGRAVFFVNGRRFWGTSPDAQARRALIRVLHERGHLFGNHTLDHVNLCGSRADIATQIDGNEALLADLIGARPTLFRAPYGTTCDALDRAMAARPHLWSLGWTVDAQEWADGATAGTAIVDAIRQMRPGSRAVVLLHDAHPATLPALRHVLAWIATQEHDAFRLLDAREVLLPFAEAMPPSIRVGLVEMIEVARARARTFLGALAPVRLAMREPDTSRQ